MLMSLFRPATPRQRIFSDPNTLFLITMKHQFRVLSNEAFANIPSISFSNFPRYLYSVIVCNGGVHDLVRRGSHRCPKKMGS